MRREAFREGPWTGMSHVKEPDHNTHHGSVAGGLSPWLLYLGLLVNKYGLLKSDVCVCGPSMLEETLWPFVHHRGRSTHWTHGCVQETVGALERGRRMTSCSW